MIAFRKIRMIIPVLLITLNVSAAEGFSNFKVAVYTRAMEVSKMKDTRWMESTWEKISSNLHVDKIYLETHRDQLMVDKETLSKAISFFKGKGLEVAGGITFTINERNDFETFCYSNPEHRKKAKEIIQYTAAHFDEIILDDFFFTSCKCDLCIQAKGNQSWADYRLKLMTNAARDLIVGPAKAVNPRVKVIVKYPNWYDHFQECGFNLETEPAIFDGLYTGTETRDAVSSDQHLQPYLGYLIVRYFENLKPGKNGGGWVDTYGSRNYDRYAEQLWLTLLAKAPQITLFEYSAMASPLRPNMVPEWSGQSTSFPYRDLVPFRGDETMGKAAALALKAVDACVGKLGSPVGIKSYKPFHSSGEDFLQNYLGMMGIPMNLVSVFPMDDPMVLLTEQAQKDPGIVQKIEKRLRAGKDVMITSGLLSALQERGIRNIVNLTVTGRKVLVDDFKLNAMVRAKSYYPILMPQIQYFTNDSWEMISGMSHGLGWPLLHRGKYGSGTLYVLTIPDNYADLYALPAEVLNRIREVVCGPLGIRITGPSQVSLFLYDNRTFVVESFRDDPVEIQVVMTSKSAFLNNLVTGEKMEVKVTPARSFMGMQVAPESFSYSIKLPPHSFRSFAIN